MVVVVVVVVVVRLLSHFNIINYAVVAAAVLSNIFTDFVFIPHVLCVNVSDSRLFK